MPLIETQSFTNQAINAGKTITFAAVAENYEQVNLRVFLYDLAAVSSAKSVTCQITRSGSGVLSRLILTPSITTASTSVVLSTDLFTLGTGDAMTIIVTGGATDTANGDIVAELWGIPDLSAQISTFPTVATIWDRLVTAITTAGSIGKLIKDNLDAAISTRATPADVVSSVAVTAANAATLAAGNVAFTSYAHNSQNITSTSTEDLASATVVSFAMKDSYQETDAQSLMFINNTVGLTHVGKSAIVAPIVTTDGSLTVSGSSGAWVFTVVLKSEAAALLAEYAGSGKLGEVKVKPQCVK